MYIVSNKWDILNHPTKDIMAIIDWVNFEEDKIRICVRYEVGDLGFYKMFEFEVDGEADDIKVETGHTDEFALTVMKDNEKYLSNPELTENIIETIQGVYPENNVIICYGKEMEDGIN